MKTVFEKINEILEKSSNKVIACYTLNDSLIDEIYQTGAYEDLFKRGINNPDERKNCVYGLIGTLYELKKQK